MRNKPDPRIPVPAPPGFKWHVARTMLVDGHTQLLELGLWPEDAEPNEWGVAPVDSCIKSSRAIADAVFRIDQPHKVRKTSQRVLDQLAREGWGNAMFEIISERVRRA